MSESVGTHVFKDRLREARLRRGFGQGELATKASLPAASISHFESGARKPSFENLRRLSQALTVSTDYLLGRTDEIATAMGGDPLYRDFQRLTGKDREYAEVFLKALAEKGRIREENTE